MEDTLLKDPYGSVFAVMPEEPSDFPKNQKMLNIFGLHKILRSITVFNSINNKKCYQIRILE